MSAKSSRPEPGWYVASDPLDSSRSYVVVVPTSWVAPVVAVWIPERSKNVSTYAYPDDSGENFPWDYYTLEKLA